MEPTWLQIILGSLVLMCSMCVILARNPVVSAVMLMATLFLTGALYFSLGFFFIGAVQILIYAGAISVLFIFIVMLLDLRTTFVAVPGRRVTLGLALLAAGVLLAALVPAVVPMIGGSAAPTLGGAIDGGAAVVGEVASAALAPSSAKTIALQFLSKYMIPFQVTGLLLLAAVMGVTVLGKHNTQKSEG